MRVSISLSLLTLICLVSCSLGGDFTQDGNGTSEDGSDVSAGIDMGLAEESLATDILHQSLQGLAPSRTLNVLATPVSLPSLFLLPEKNPDGLSFLREVPVENERTFQSSQKKIPRQLKLLSEKMKVGYLETDRNPILFDEQGEKTKAFKTYEKFLDKIKELQLKKENASQSEAAYIQQEINQFQNAWNTKPNGPAIALAVQQHLSNSQLNNSAFLREWQEEIAAGEERSVGIDWEVMARQGQWRKLESSSTKLKSYSFLINGNASDDEIEVKPGGIRISLNYVVAMVNHPDLTKDVLNSDLWASETVSLSNGSEQQASKTELIPRYISHALVCKGWEIAFDDEALWDQVSKALSGEETESITIGGFKIQKKQIWVAPKLIVVQSPAIFAVEVEKIKKTPDPNSSLKFKGE